MEALPTEKVFNSKEKKKEKVSYVKQSSLHKHI